MIKILLLALSLFVTSASGAMDTTKSYLNKRDKAIVEIRGLTARMPPEAAYKAMDESLHGLQRMLKKLIGPICIEGFPEDGENNNTTLLEEPGYGALMACK